MRSVPRLAAAAAAAIVACIAPPLAAQSPAARRPELTVSVRPARAWFGPQTRLGVEAVVSAGDEAATGLRATVALYDRLRSRSQLRELLDGRVPRVPLEAFTYRLEDLPARGSQKLTVDQGLDTLRAFQGAQDGLYPLAVTVRRSTGATVRTATTAVAFFGDVPQTPLNAVPVLAVTSPSLLGPDGRPTRRTDGDLVAMRRGVAPVAGVPFALDVSPLLLDQLRALAETPVRARAEALEAALRDAAATAQVLAVPYVPVRSAHGAEVLGGSWLTEQLRAGAATTRRWLGVSPTDVFAPPGLELDSRTLQSLRTAGIRACIVSGEQVPPAARGLTPADPVSVGGVVLLPSDEAIARAAADGERGVARALAESAMAYFESPGRQRAIAVVVEASSGRFPELLAGMRDAPWLHVLSPSQAADLRWRQPRTFSLPEPARPARAYTRSLSEARDAVQRLEAFTFDGNPSVGRLRASVDASAATAWWADDWSEGVGWSRGVVRAAAREQRLISTAVSAPVTFTSRRGQVPVTVVNRAGYPVRVRVEVSSPNLRFPSGAARDLDPLNPPGEVVIFAALTEASGTFPLTVRLTSPDGAVLVDEKELAVRSTALNFVAVALTLGAAGFLVVWSGRRMLARRGRTRSPAPGAQEAQG